METIRVTKLEAASRQADVAIDLLFNGRDLVAVHTLAGAASHIASDLAERRIPTKSWDRHAQIACGLDAKTYFSIMRQTQNFLKHAKTDADSEHEFAVTDTPSVLASAVFNLGQLTGMLTLPQSVFQLWHLACNLDALDPTFEYRDLLRSHFGNLSRRSMTYRFAIGRRELRRAILDDKIESEVSWIVSGEVTAAAPTSGGLSD